MQFFLFNHIENLHLNDVKKIKENPISFEAWPMFMPCGWGIFLNKPRYVSKILTNLENNSKD